MTFCRTATPPLAPSPFLARIAAISILAGALGACATKQQSTPLPAAVASEGLRIERSLPKELPAESTPFPGSQFVLISTDNAAGMLVPVPFVADAVVGAIHQHEARQLAGKYAALDPYAIVRSALEGSAILARSGTNAVLHPLAYIVNCSDDLSRVALVARVQSTNWNGRYMAHLPATYLYTTLATGKSDALDTLRSDMMQGATVLRRLVEQDARGEPTRTLYKADVGSMNLACSTPSGVVSAKLMQALNTDVVEESADHIVVRIAGDAKESGRPRRPDVRPRLPAQGPAAYVQAPLNAHGFASLSMARWFPCIVAQCLRSPEAALDSINRRIE